MNKSFYFLLAIFPFFLSTSQAKQRGTIIQVASQLPLNRHQIGPPKEYYVNLGRQNGVRPSQTLDVFRIQPVVSALTGHPADFIKIPIGKLRVLTVGRSSCLARVVSLEQPNELPKLDYPAMMVGDRVEFVTRGG